MSQLSKGNQGFKFTIPAGDIHGVSVQGVGFYLKACTAQIEVKTDTTAFQSYRKGQGESYSPPLNANGEIENAFTRLEFKNPNAFTVTVEVWAGYGDFRDNRFEIVDAYSEITGEATNTIAGAATVTLNGNPTGNQIQRKALLVTNLDPSSNLEILDTDDNICLYVLPSTSITFPCSGVVKVKNNTGSAISLAISQIWYVENVG